MDVYLNSLPEKMRAMVEGPFQGNKRFKFANKQTLKSVSSLRIPICPTGRIEMISVDVLPTDIPFLMSKSDMKRLEMVINLVTEKATVRGREVSLDFSAAGHPIMPLLRQAENFCVEEIFAINLKELNEKEKEKALVKLHKQFGHRPKDVFVTLLKNANVWSNDMSQLIDKIVDNCEGCILRKRNPDRPSVSLPMANDFNEKVCIDLKHWENGFIFYMIDMYTRYTAAAFITRKTCNEIVDKFMKHWVSIFGSPGAILNDNGGEFTGEEVKELKEALCSVDCTTAAEAPWQNGICERNHAVVDNILFRIVADYPDMKIETALAWACSAKNALQQVYGFSPYQLVFGRNPKLPNILADGPPSWEEKAVGSRLAEHLNALHKTRIEFTKSESESRIKKALKAKVVATELDLKSGDLVYYKRDNEVFKGPAKVIVQDGKVIFVREGSQVYRVSANRVVRVGEELRKKLEDSKTDTEKENCTSIPEQNLKVVERNAGQKCRDKENCTPSSIQTENADDEWDSIVFEKEKKDLVEQSRKRQAEEEVSCESRPVSKTLRVNLKKNDIVEYRVKDGELKKCVIMGPAGKATGPYKNWYNVENEDRLKQSVDFGNADFNVVREEGEVCLAMLPDNLLESERCVEAKRKEIEKLKLFETYDEVVYNGQELITTRWVVVTKDDEIRARLVARGFEEQGKEIVSDSPTMLKVSFRAILSIATQNEWKVETIDIKSAFLQGQTLDREVFIKPPKEAETRKVWKLKKCLYGLKDASRNWYENVKISMIELNCEVSKLDPALFIYKENSEVRGFLGAHVDDFLFAGTKSFHTNVIRKLIEKFSVGKHEMEKFLYTGFNISQEEERIVLDQTNYVDKLEVRKVSAERLKEKKDTLSSMEYTDLRRYVGALNWIVRATRPDLSFDLINLSTKFNNGTVEDLNKARKIIRSLPQVENKIVFRKLDKQSLFIRVYTDASFGNLNEGVDSMAACIVFLVDKHERCIPLDWVANKVKRVVKSTIAAETLALANGIDQAIFARRLISELLGWKEETLQIEAIIDNKSCLEAVNSTSLVDDKRLRREIASIKELLETKELQTVKWVPGDKQLADVLTKSGASNLKLMTVLHSGKF